MTDRTRKARSGSGVRRARLVSGKRSGDDRMPQLKAKQAQIFHRGPDVGKHSEQVASLPQAIQAITIHSRIGEA